MKPNRPSIGAACCCCALLAGTRVAAGTPVATNLNEYLLAPLRIHLLSAPDRPAVTTTLTATDVARILLKINRVWAQAGMNFYLESLLNEEAANLASGLGLGKPDDRSVLLSLRPAASQATNLLHVYYLKRMLVNGVYLGPAIFVKDTASLREVEGGIDEPLPRVTSHELGHAFGLPHRQDTTNLMASGTTGIWLNDEEVRQVRDQALKLPWIEPATTVRRKAAELIREGKTNEAGIWCRRLAAIPLTAD